MLTYIGKSAASALLGLIVLGIMVEGWQYAEHRWG
jgi:hypothetical protein